MIHLAPLSILRSALGSLVCFALLIGCGGSFERTMHYREIPSVNLGGREMTYAVYTPPGYQVGERLPLVVFLHGGGDDAASFDRAGLPQVLDRASEGGEIPRVIMVLPQGDLGFWANWHDGSMRYEDWVTHEVMPRVAHEFQTLPCPDYCHVMGVSMGGSGTLRFALHRPDLFATATMISAPILDTNGMIQLAQNPLLVPIVPMDRIFGPTRDAEAPLRVRDDDPFMRWQGDADRGGMRLMLAWGSHDRPPIIETNRRFHTALTARHVSHRYLEFDGNHSWVSWSPVILTALERMVPPSPWENPPSSACRNESAGWQTSGGSSGGTQRSSGSPGPSRDGSA